MGGRRRLALLAAVAAMSVPGMQVHHALAGSAYRGIAPLCRAVVPGRTVALSFDDGPSPRFTPQVLRLLKREGDQATFFVIGAEAATYPDLVRMELQAGMEVGNHTWSHLHLTRLSPGQRRFELERAAAELAALGVPPAQARLFRPPYGDVDPATLRLIRSDGLVPILWSVSVEHYTVGLGLGPREAAARLLHDIRPGDIILAHDGGGDRSETVATLDLVLPLLKARGFEVVTVGSFVHAFPMDPADPRSMFWERGLRCSRGADP